MAKKNSYITVTDQFCGAGGSSQGVRRLSKRYGGGVEVKLALNHWKLAIETHNTNFPDTFHDCTDISACDPRRYLSTDILITSPECTTHSPAGGNNHKALRRQMDMFSCDKIDPATERSRATMWDVCRFAEYHNYNCIIVENVVEAKTRWALFDVWLMAMHKLGYNHKCVYLNSMHCHPTPQSRDRMYVVFWKQGNKAPKLDYMPVAYCPKCNRDVAALQTWKNSGKQFGKYRQQYVYCCSTCTSIVEPYYYAAFNCIDWSDIGVRIGDRKLKKYDKPFKGEYWLPLAPNSMIRVDYGLKKYGRQPLQVLNYTPGYTKPVTEPTSGITCFDHHAILQHPFIVKGEHTSKDAAYYTRSIGEDFQTQTVRHSMSMVVPPFLVNDQHTTGIDFRVKSVNDALHTVPTNIQTKLLTPPFIVNHNHSSKADPIHKPMGVQMASDRYSLFVQPPFLTEMYSGGKAREVSSELNTATAGGIKTGLVTNEAWNSFIDHFYTNPQPSQLHEPLNTQPAREVMAIANYKEPKIEDCYYRMLKPREIKLAMAFDNDYIVLGSSKDQVKQLGNAVTPPAMEWLVQQCIESLS